MEEYTIFSCFIGNINKKLLGVEKPVEQQLFVEK